jgi:hypothetical protein
LRNGIDGQAMKKDPDVCFGNLFNPKEFISDSRVVHIRNRVASPKAEQKNMLIRN